MFRNSESWSNLTPEGRTSLEVDVDLAYRLSYPWGTLGVTPEAHEAYELPEPNPAHLQSDPALSWIRGRKVPMVDVRLAKPALEPFEPGVDTAIVATDFVPRRINVAVSLADSKLGFANQNLLPLVQGVERTGRSFEDMAEEADATAKLDILSKLTTTLTDTLEPLLADRFQRQADKKFLRQVRNAGAIALGGQMFIAGANQASENVLPLGSYLLLAGGHAIYSLSDITNISKNHLASRPQAVLEAQHNAARMAGRITSDIYRSLQRPREIKPESGE